MSAALVFYTNLIYRGRTVRWMLDELAAPCRAELLEFGTMRSGEHLAINPIGKVPAMRHGEAVVTWPVAVGA